MTKDDIIRMAREAGFWQEHVNTWMCSSADIERFVALVAAAEREACAKTCEERIDFWQRDDGRRYEDEYCADAIRARGEATLRGQS